MLDDTELRADRKLVVVGADFTPASRAAVERAKCVAASTDSALLLAHVVAQAAVVNVPSSPGSPETIPMPAPSPEGAAALQAAGDLANERVALDLVGFDADAVIRIGTPAEELAAIADLRGAWLLVVGVREGLAPDESLVLGTTAELALRHGSTPVLVARGTRADYRRVLLPLEPDDISLLVLRAVALLAPDASYDVVHFVPASGGDAAAALTHRRAVVAELTGLCVAAGLDPARTHVLSFGGEPREGVVAEMRRRRPDLVAMGTRARSGIARVAFGSLADHVIHAASGVDVLAVPPQSQRRSPERAGAEASASQRAARQPLPFAEPGA